MRPPPGCYATVRADNGVGAVGGSRRGVGGRVSLAADSDAGKLSSQNWKAVDGASSDASPHSGCQVSFTWPPTVAHYAPACLTPSSAPAAYSKHFAKRPLSPPPLPQLALWLISFVIVVVAALIVVVIVVAVSLFLSPLVYFILVLFFCWPY